jgi:hypothetical protein
MGELLKQTVTAGNPSIVTRGEQLPPGITRKQSHQFQQLANHLEIVEQVPGSYGVCVRYLYLAFW